ncbi:MAG: hypothetical protein LBH48_03485 [Bifidobacteriaceae bacterium]|jgi:hypothetical protein|nr:hypothetical protein [Bifidobacteriaceae bacterium]
MTAAIAVASGGAVIVGTPGVAMGGQAAQTTQALAPALAPKTPASVGAWRPIKPVNVLGGTSGRSVAASRDVILTLSRPGSIPSSRNSWVVTVAISGAPGVGQLQISTPGQTATGSPSISYSKGATVATMLIQVNAESQLRLRSSKGIRVAMTAQAYLTGAATTPGPGGTKTIPHYSLVRSDKKLGPAIPGPGSHATVPVLGSGGIPTSGVRGVWLSVQTHSKGVTGSLGFSKADGGGSPGTPVAEVRRGWATSLVLAPVSADGKILYRVNGGAPTTLRIVAVGYVQASSSTDEKTVINNSLTLSSNRKVTPKLRGNYTKSKVKQKIYSMKVTGTSVPSATTRVIVRLTVAGGSKGGEFKHQRTKSSVRNAKPIMLPKGSVANIVFNQLVGANGTIFVSIPQGGSVLNGAVIATVLKAKNQSVDPAPPTGTINPISGGSIDLAKTPQVTITGTAQDTVSGIRSVAVYKGQAFLGSAVVDTTKATPTWSLTTSLGAGPGTIWARIKDFSARYFDTPGQAVNVTVPPPATAVVNPDVQVVPQATCDTVTSTTATTVVFSGTFDAKPGAVIVCDKASKVPGGFIRRVASLRTVSGKTTVTTTDASLLDALVQGEFSIDDAPLGDPTAGRTIKAPQTTLTGVSVDGSLGLSGSADFNLALATAWQDGPLGKPTLSRLAYDIALNASTEATVTGAADAPATAVAVKTPTYTPAKVELAPARFNLGTVPVVLTATAAPTIVVEGTGQVGTDATAQVDFATTTGATLTDVRTSTWAMTHTEDATGTSSVRAGAPAVIAGTWKTVVDVGIAGLPGPTITLEAGVDDTVAPDPAGTPSPTASATPTVTPTDGATPDPSATPTPPASVPGWVSTLVAKGSGSISAPAQFLGIAGLTPLAGQVPAWSKPL